MPRNEDPEFDEDFDQELDDEPIPARRDTKIFQIKKEKSDEDEEEFDEDVFV